MLTFDSNWKIYWRNFNYFTICTGVVANFTTGRSRNFINKDKLLAHDDGMVALVH